ncbi:MAG: N-6 DNA methylase, partial [Chloroflexota bacterium]
ETGLTNELAYAILGRSILIRYLEDRGVLTDLLGQLDSILGRQSYREILRDAQKANTLFDVLTERFNGDLFPVTREENDSVTQEHLNLVADFLDGTKLEGRQLAFWPYDFSYVPIELISGIYDTFLNVEARKIDGTYYTPHTLVDFVLAETLPPDLAKSSMRILDPACGSGVFLVRAYQRVVEAWITENNGKRPDSAQLHQLMSQAIFGVDIDPSAIRIATFSLYLAMLDFLRQAEFSAGDFKFPVLKDRNLIIGDFFSDTVQELLGVNKFDRIVGNPPWVSGLTPAAEKWLKQHKYTVGDYQIAEAFLLIAPQLCNGENGEVALLAPARGMLTSISGTHEQFRQTFFRSHSVRAIFNLAALCYELFEDAIHPTVVIIYSPSLPNPDDKFAYLTPKPTSLFQHMGIVMLETTDIKYISLKRVLEFPKIWKIALWGNSRDEALIEKLERFPKLEDVATQFTLGVHEGVIRGGKPALRKSAPWLNGMPLVKVDKFQPYILNRNSTEVNPYDKFERAREQEIIRAPLALIRQSPAGGQCSAAYCETDTVYTNSITGVTGQSGFEWLLKWLVIYINSPLASYYHFMTSTRWAVERGNILHEEYKKMPFAVPRQNDKDPRIIRAVSLFDELAMLLSDEDIFAISHNQARVAQIQIELSDLVFDIFNVYSAERQLIRDTLEYGIEFFNWGKRKDRKPNGTNAVRQPTYEIMSGYANTFVDAANTLLRYQNQLLSATVYQDGAPLAVVGFHKSPVKDSSKIESVVLSSETNAVLLELDKLLIEARTASVFLRRIVRIYEGDWLYFVKPAEQRFWSKSQALVDADDVLNEWLTQPDETMLEGNTHA